MKRSRFSEEQIIGILKEHESGVPIAGLDTLLAAIQNAARPRSTKNSVA
ncbi:hypothetical protein [Pleomorphomonas sp. NRK KF1]|nr:hypothetical protein [Pleomorphomonas sp. NRK KF1]MCM5555730.1 hypothetical protein [Pleomorphomonas sp. NRK KF1]